jgi:hypothetical protein
MYADAVGKLWRGAEEERREVVAAAVEAAAVREQWKREAEVQVVGKELGGEGREEEWCTGKKAAALHKAFEKLQSAAETNAQDVRIIPKPPDTDGGGVGKFTGDAGGGRGEAPGVGARGGKKKGVEGGEGGKQDPDAAGQHAAGSGAGGRGETGAERLDDAGVDGEGRDPPGKVKRERRKKKKDTAVDNGDECG